MTIRYKTLDEADEFDDLAALPVDHRVRSSLCQTPISVLDISSRLAITYPNDSINLAVRRMREKGIGSVVVIDPESHELTGILTERDLLNKIVGKGIDHKKARVKDYMTPNPEYLNKHDKIAYALHKMSVLGFRHVPITNVDHQVEGIVSVRTVVDYLVEQLSNEIYNLRPDPLRKGFSAREGA